MADKTYKPDALDKLLEKWSDKCVICCTTKYDPKTGEPFCTKNNCKDLGKFKKDILKWQKGLKGGCIK